MTMKRLFKSSLWLMIAFFSLLVTTGCKNKRYQTHIDGQSCVITSELKKTLKEYKDVLSVKDGLIVVNANNMKTDETGQNYYPKGCIDMKGNVIIPLKYYGILIGDGSFVVFQQTRQGRRSGLLDMDGNEILPIEYEEIVPDFFQNGIYKYFRIKKDGRYGLIDNKGKVMIPLQFEDVRRFYTNSAYRSYTEQELPDIYLAYRNKTDKPELFNLSPEKMEKKTSTLCDVVPLGNNGNWSFMDYQGHIIAGPYQNIKIPSDFQTPLFPDGLAVVVKNNKVGFIDMQGMEKIPFNYYYTEFDFNIHADFGLFSEGLAAMMQPGNKWGYVDNKGNTVIPFVYDWAGRFHQGTAMVGNFIDGKEIYGIIDKNNTIVLPFEFETGVYTGNVYALCQNDKWGVYSPTGVCLTPCQYDQQITFVGGYATVAKNGKQGLINEQGQLLIPCEYKTCMYDASNGSDVVIVCKDGKWGVLDLQNQVLVPVEFDAVSPIIGYNGNLFGVTKDGRNGLYDSCGNCTLD